MPRRFKGFGPKVKGAKVGAIYVNGRKVWSGPVSRTEAMKKMYGGRGQRVTSRIINA